MIVSTGQLPNLLSKCLEADLTPFVKGPPAIGKSDIIKQVAAEYNLKVIDFRLSQADPTDMGGLPTYLADPETGVNTKATFLPMDSFPIEGDPLPKNANGKEYDGWLLFLDELNSANLSVQASAFKLILDREVGKHKLHSHVRIVAAGNRETDRAITNRMSTPMQSRLAHFELQVDHKQWLKWAANNNIDFRITSFISFKTESLYNFKPDHDKDTYASPRTWEFCDRLINGIPNLGSDMVPLIASVVGEASAREFWTYAKIFKNLLTIDQIIADPLKVPVPEEQGTLFALSGSIGQHMTPANAAPLMQFAERMHIEFQTLVLQTAMPRDLRTGDPKKPLNEVPAIKKWIRSLAAELF